MAYKSLSKDEQARFDPMITGFNPTDMYAADHVRRVLRTFPGVFSGIGEFSIHKEFVSAKISGEVASPSGSALDRLVDFATEVGLVVLIHNDRSSHSRSLELSLHMPLKSRRCLTSLKPRPSSGRISARSNNSPVKSQAAIVEDIIKDPGLARLFRHLFGMRSRYVVATPSSTSNAAEMISTTRPTSVAKSTSRSSA